MNPFFARADLRIPSSRTRGFSLIELMITLVVLALVTGAIMTVLLTSGAQKTLIGNEANSTSMARSALDIMSRDLRCAAEQAQDREG